MATYKPLQSVALTSATASVTFSGIDQGYTDLVVVINATTTSDTQVRLGFNSDTGTPYSSTILYGDGSSAGSVRVSNEASMNIGGVGQNTGTNLIHINSYSNTTTNKTALGRYSELSPSYGEAALKVGLWRNTAAITSVTFTLGTGNYSAGSTFSLYGIKSGAPQALGGDVVTTDGTYWYHAFRSTGAFTPQRPLTADVLVVAGGAGTGQIITGGGGAGGLLAFTNQSLTPANYPITVGAGGAATSGFGTTGNNGNDSQFGSLTLVKGGGRPGTYNTNGSAGSTGGSGGGGGAGDSGGSGGAGGSPTSGQGNAGGAGSFGSNAGAGGGGGGAGAAGANGTGSGTTAAVGGAGGAGTNAYSSWATATSTGVSGFYAGGGGGAVNFNVNSGAGGAGGGGKGANNAPSDAVAGTANTGGGAGGGGNGKASASGGSGLVIVRYPV
jgi:hypothetical protein